MINIVAPSHRVRGIALADRLLAELPADPTFGGRYSDADVQAARSELTRRRGIAGAAIERIRQQMHEDARAFVELTEEFIASNPPMLRGE